MPKECDIMTLFQQPSVKYALHKRASFVTVRITTLATPLIQAYQGEFFYA